MPTLKYNPQEPLAPGRPPEGWCPHDGDANAHSHAAGWLAHVEAGRIGARIPMTAEQRLRHHRNERILLRFGE